MTKSEVQPEWVHLWRTLHRRSDQPPHMFLEWTWPHDAQAFKGMRVLDAGCGGGQHAAWVAQHAREVVAVDRSTSSLVSERLAEFPHVRVVAGDIAHVGPEDLGGTFDVVYSIGVIHHTDDPDATFSNLVRCVRPGGLLITWVYSREGNEVARKLVEPLRKALLRHLPGNTLEGISWALTVPALAAAHTLYRLPLASHLLPMSDYLKYQRTLPARRVAANVLDKLLAPRTEFIDRNRADRWLAHPELEPAHISPFLGVSWRISARRKLRASD